MKKQKTEKLKHKIPNGNKGITLIALIITIIVMLILVSVTITMAVNGGLFEYAQRAVGETKNAIDKEQEFATGALNIAGTWYNSIDEYMQTEENDEVNFEELFKTATKHPEQTETDDIGIAEDGTIVNLDLWYYDLIGNDDEYTLTNMTGCEPAKGYKGSIVGVEPECTIEGKVPMYIKEKEENNFYPVTSMYMTFYFMNIDVAPEIPSTVKDLRKTFFRSSIRNAPVIPDGVIDLTETFGWTNLMEVDIEIPSSVKHMDETFSGCTDMRGTVFVKAFPTSYTNCFYGACGRTGADVVLDGPYKKVLNALLSTGSSSHITIKQ